jgi:protein phosphatase 1G
MQGWRNTMEDSHIACVDLGDGSSIFGVFDGHGGILTYFPTRLIHINAYLL